MLYDKKSAAIKKIHLRTATFHDVEIEPTVVNFFYGRNGVGKSTIAEAINSQNELIEWQDEKTADDFEVFVYDQHYIDRNFKSFDQLPGVFTFLKENIDIREDINLLDEQQRQLKNSKNKIAQEIEKLKNQFESEKEIFRDSIWKNTASKREKYAKTQIGFQKSKLKFAEKILSYNSPNTHDIDDLDRLYDTVYGEDAKKYDELIIPPKIYEYKNFEEKKLLSKSIVNSSDTDFASFVRALKATSWIAQGKDYLPTTNGKCPFCQQNLPPYFEDDLASCFDSEYQNNIAALKKYLSDYSQHMERLNSAFDKMLNNSFPAVKESPLENLIETFKARVDGNIELINKKIREPSLKIKKEGTKKILEKIVSVAYDINEEIKKHNSLIEAKKEKQAECTERVFLYMAFVNFPFILTHKKRLKKFSADIQNQEKQLEQIDENILINKNKIADLTNKIINIRKVKDDINNLLYQSGFQGFSLREKPDDLSAYEIVRENGRPAKNLSEGERNFIAFLYFYHSVCNGIPNNSESKPKVVVIDDPVSSMDSNALFIISSMVRKMVKACQSRSEFSVNSADQFEIDQMFILTHNVYFHREITLEQCASSLFKVVDLYLIRKTDNHSSIRQCVRQSEFAPSQMENYNPVKNSYTVLWDEYKELKNPMSLLNVIRQILEYYFIHLCGYDGLTLEKVILEENRDCFVTEFSDGSTDSTNRVLASAMIQHINRTPLFLDDDLHFISEEDNTDKYRKVFKNIFVAMGQSQHYEMMMGTHN